jgi:hypothetical protein
MLLFRPGLLPRRITRMALTAYKSKSPQHSRICKHTHMHAHTHATPQVHTVWDCGFDSTCMLFSPQSRHDTHWYTYKHTHCHSLPYALHCHTHIHTNTHTNTHTHIHTHACQHLRTRTCVTYRQKSACSVPGVGA